MLYLGNYYICTDGRTSYIKEELKLNMRNYAQNNLKKNHKFQDFPFKENIVSAVCAPSRILMRYAFFYKKQLNLKIMNPCLKTFIYNGQKKISRFFY